MVHQFLILGQSSMMDPVDRLMKFSEVYGANLLATVALLLVGWILARVGKVLVERLLRLIKLDWLSEKSGVEKVLKTGVRHGIVEIIGHLTYWIVLILMVVGILNIWDIELGLSAQLLPLLPKIILALVVLIGGLYLASLVGNIVASAAARSKLLGTPVLGSVVRWILIVFVALAALNILGVEAAVVSNTFLIILASVGLTAALAIGLGLRPIVEERLRAYLKSLDQKD
jgi:hypothetical protein